MFRILGCTSILLITTLSLSICASAQPGGCADPALQCDEAAGEGRICHSLQLSLVQFPPPAAAPDSEASGQPSTTGGIVLLVEVTPLAVECEGMRQIYVEYFPNPGVTPDGRMEVVPSAPLFMMSECAPPSSLFIQIEAFSITGASLAVWGVVTTNITVSQGVVIQGPTMPPRELRPWFVRAKATMPTYTSLDTTLRGSEHLVFARPLELTQHTGLITSGAGSWSFSWSLQTGGSVNVSFASSYTPQPGPSCGEEGP